MLFFCLLFLNQSFFIFLRMQLLFSLFSFFTVSFFIEILATLKTFIMGGRGTSLANSDTLMTQKWVFRGIRRAPKTTANATWPRGKIAATIPCKVVAECRVFIAFEVPRSCAQECLRSPCRLLRWCPPDRRLALPPPTQHHRRINSIPKKVPAIEYLLT